MPTKPETQFITSVHKHLSPDVYRMKNNNPYVGGIPDCWYSGLKSDLWVEYKFIPVKTPKSQVVPDLSKLQLRWLKGRLKEGRNVLVIVGFKDGGVKFTTPEEWENGIDPFEFLARAVSRKDLAAYIYKHCCRRNPL